jgi:hypothetical protein
VDIVKTISPIATVVFLVCAAWPLNLPLLALAVKVRRGTAPLEYDGPREFWLRSALGSVGVAAVAWVMLGLMYFLIVLQELSPAAGLVQLTLLLLLVPTAAGLIFWAMALEDFFQGLAVFGAYVLVPGLPLFLIGAFLNWMNWLPALPSWLLSLN